MADDFSESNDILISQDQLDDVERNCAKKLRSVHQLFVEENFDNLRFFDYDYDYDESGVSSRTIEEEKEIRDDIETETKKKRKLKKSSIRISSLYDSSAGLVSTEKGWGMGFRKTDGSRRRGTDSNNPHHRSTRLISKIKKALSKIDYYFGLEFVGTNRYSIRTNTRNTNYSRSKTISSTTSGATPRLFSVIVCILLFVLGEFSCIGDAFSSNCVAEQCAVEFMRALDHDKVLIGPNLPYCTLLSNYGSCLNRTSRSCRGNLKFHSLNTMVMTQIRDHNCTALIEYRRKYGSLKTSLQNGGGGKLVKNMTVGGTTLDLSPEDNSDNHAGGSGRCLFPYQHQKGAGGYRYCSMFGDPHLRTFEGQYETCRTLGAWPLMDNSYFGVQVTNDQVAEGVDASGISKVTVIVKSLPGCTDQKMFEATKDFLPSTFVDGTTNSGEPNTNSISGSSYHYAPPSENRGGETASEGSRPSVLIRTIEIDRHIEINLRYISTRVVIRRVGNYLTVAIKIPEEVIAQRSSLNTLQLCLTGCPSTERINYKEVLAYPDYYVKKWGARSPAMSRDQAMDTCRQSGVTDFFFDSCVFDLLMTGDESFKESAAAAMNDIRQLYPPYRKHYETRRSDLLLYDELAKLGRELENEEKRDHTRRREKSWSNDQQQDERSIPRSIDGVAKARTSSAYASTVRNNSICMLLLFLSIIGRRLVGYV